MIILLSRFCAKYYLLEKILYHTLSRNGVFYDDQFVLRITAVNSGLNQGMSAQEILDYAYEYINSAMTEERAANIDVLRDAGLWTD